MKLEHMKNFRPPKLAKTHPHPDTDLVATADASAGHGCALPYRRSLERDGFRRDYGIGTSQRESL